MTAAAFNLNNRRGSSSVSSLWALFLLSLRQHLHGKRWMVVSGLFLLPTVLAIIVRETNEDMPTIVNEFLMAFMVIPQTLLPLGALIYASGIIQDELEEQTITYPLMRPIPKWGLYLVKLAATVITVSCLTAIFTTITYIAVYAGGDTPAREVAERCAKAAGLHCLAAGTYCCLFALMSMVTKRALIAGILYAAFVEGLLANLPFSVRLLTVIYYSRLIAYRVLPFVVPDSFRNEDIAANAWQLDVRHDPDLSEHPAMGTCIIVLLTASAVCALLGAFICWKREFYVKTPEKS